MVTRDDLLPYDKTRLSKVLQLQHFACFKSNFTNSVFVAGNECRKWQYSPEEDGLFPQVQHWGVAQKRSECLMSDGILTSRCFPWWICFYFKKCEQCEHDPISNSHCWIVTVTAGAVSGHRQEDGLIWWWFSAELWPASHLNRLQVQTDIHLRPDQEILYVKYVLIFQSDT